MARIFYDNDADLGVLSKKVVSIIGFGSQGHAHALNLRDSGIDVIVGLRENSSSWNKAESEGLKVMRIEEAADKGDIVALLTPDETQKNIYYEKVKEGLKLGDTLLFAHGFNIHFNQIIPEKETDVIMVAPKGPGSLVRRLFTEGSGTPGLIAIYQDYSGKAKEVALAYAKGVGCGRAGIIETTFAEETETDLFGEQAVLCGGTSALIKAGFETLVEAGYQPEIAYFECLHELKLIVDLIYEKGISGMRSVISNTAEYGDMTVGPKVIDENVKKNMREILTRIKEGKFAREWILENQAGKPVYNALKKEHEKHKIEEVGEQLRSMMSWIK